MIIRQLGALGRWFLVGLLLAAAQTQATSGQDLVHLNRTNYPELPEGLHTPVPASIGDNPVILGGWTVAPDSTLWSGRAWMLDPVLKTWTELSNVGDAVRQDAAVVVAGAGLVIAGGLTEDGWTTQLSELTGTGSDVRVVGHPDLPAALHHPAAAAAGRTLTVAGIVESDAGRFELQAYTIDLDQLPSSSWSALPPFEIEAGGPVTLASQDGGINVTVFDGRTISMYRYTSLKGWTVKSPPPQPMHPRAAFTMGQAHIGYANVAVPGVLGIWSYSVITDTWARSAQLELPYDRIDGTASGVALLLVSSSHAESTAQLTRVEFEVGKRHFYWLDFLAVAVYLGAMILIGIYFSRRESGTEDFFVGGRRMPWWAVGFSLYATGTSAVSFMAIPAKSYATDWLYLAQNAVGLVAIIPVALIIVPLIRRLSLTTTYEYLEMRFHVAIRLMGSILNMTYQLGARMSVVLFLPALALSAVTGIDVVTSIVFMGVIATVYTVLGGIKAVIWTDVVQVVVLLGGALLCLVIVIAGIDGGLGGLMAITAADNKMHMFDWRFDLTIPTVWLFLILATADTITWPRDQVMVQRVLSTKTASEAGWSVWTLAAIVVPGSVTFFSLGTALYGFYKVHPEKLSPLLNLDATLPYFIAAELPVGVAGLIIAALFAASMSTLDSSMNSVSTLIVVDWYQRFKKDATDEMSLRLAKWMTVATGVFGTGFALLLTRYSLPSLFDTFIMLTGLLGGGFGGVYALGMFTRRANWQGAMVGIVTSIFATLAVKAYTNIHVLLYVGVAIVTCVVVGYLVSLFFPPQHGHLEGLTVYRVDNGGRSRAEIRRQDRDDRLSQAGQ